MKLKTFLVVVLTTLAFSLSAETAYQKKTYQIYEKYFTLFKDGYSHGLTTGEAIVFSMNPEAMTAGAAAEAMSWCPINKLESYIKQMEKELAQAESLMTSEERKKKAEQDALNARLKNSKGCLEMAIQTKLKQWATKGEFEKTEDYKKRLQEEGNAQFRAVCAESFPHATFNVKPLKYDADKELYDFQIKYTLLFTNKSYTHEISAAIPIGVDEARILSQNTPKITIIDCVWGEYEHNITPKSYKILINEHIYNAKTKAIDLVIKGLEIMPDLIALKSVSYNYTIQQTEAVAQQLIVRQELEARKDTMLQEIEILNQKAKSQEMEINKQITNSPYYNILPESQKERFLVSFKTEQFTKMDDAQIIEGYYYHLRSYNDNFFGERDKDPIKVVKEYLMQKQSDKYVQIYFEEHPDSAQFLRKEWLEYKCNYPYQNLDGFVIAYQQNKLNPSLRNCREKFWEEYGKYYENKDVFNVDFEEGEQALIEYARLCEKMTDKIENIKRYLNASVANPADNIPIAGLFTSNTKKVSSMNFQGANDSKTDKIRIIAKLFDELSESPAYQEKAASVIINESEKTQKEYEKNGKLFTSKAEFLTAYFGSNYKTILKSKK